MKNMRLATVLLTVSVAFAPNAVAAPVEDELGEKIAFLGWSKDASQIIRQGKSSDYKQLVTACPLGGGKCKVLCHSKICDASRLLQVKKIEWVKPTKPGKVYNYSTGECDTCGYKTRLRARIPGTRVAVRLGKEIRDAQTNTLNRP